MPDIEPIYKVTILARGRTGGHAVAVPEDDKGLMTRSEMIARLVFAMGGRAAEELVFREPTTGASSDIDQATKIARAMVTEYGMSSKLGAVRYGTEHGDPFLGRSMGTQADYSHEVAQIIDDEVRKLIEAAHTEAWEVLTEYRDVLDILAGELLEKETLHRAELEAIFADVKKRPRLTMFDDFGGRVPSDKPPIKTPGELAIERGEPWPLPAPEPAFKAAIAAASKAAAEDGSNGSNGSNGNGALVNGGYANGARRTAARTVRPANGGPNGTQPNYGAPAGWHAPGWPPQGPAVPAAAGRLVSAASRPPPGWQRLPAAVSAVPAAGAARSPAGARRRRSRHDDDRENRADGRRTHDPARLTRTEAPMTKPASKPDSKTVSKSKTLPGSRTFVPADFDQARAEKAVRELLYAIGEDPDRQGLLDTPARVARAYQEMFAGLYTNPDDVLNTTFDEQHDELVLVKDIPMYSTCEHHLVAFHGVAHVGYIPGVDGRVTGLSKLARVVDLYAKRPQVQERLTGQVADAVMRKLDPRGVIVVIEAEHLCMAMRGIRKPGATTTTSAVRGQFKTDNASRSEALDLILRK